MALCLAQSLLECGGFDPRDQLERYLRWLERGESSCRGKALGVGKTVLRTLIRYRRTGRVYTDIDHERFSGNGSIMRLAPVAIFYAEDIEKAVHYAALSSKTTHGSPIAVDACRLMAYILVQLYDGMGTKRLFSADFTDELTTFFSSEPLHPALQPIVEQHFRDKEAEHIKSTGYAVDTLEAALWSLFRTESFRDALLTAVNLGNDADTVGAVTGQLAGALYGVSAIPATWMEGLCKKELIATMANTLASF
jgi:ADP-ribosyl-[dinitrogen reductase] hydrolase